MPMWLEEFLVVTNASRRLQIALFAVPVVPSVIVLLGTFQLTRGRDVPEPWMPLVASISESLFYLYLVIAFIVGISCLTLAAKEYRRVHKRLFG